MRVRNRWKQLKICMVFVGLLVLIPICAELIIEIRYRMSFEDNGKDEPYSQGMPLHEMDFDVYHDYLVWAVVGEISEEQKYMELPCDVEYFSRKEDKEPALIISKGTEVSIFPVQPLYGYGLRCWPDYDSKWRYGRPFTESGPLIGGRKEQMYYVPEAQLEEVAAAYYRKWEDFIVLMNRDSDEKSFVEQLIHGIDEMLYRNGAFCAPRR